MTGIAKIFKDPRCILRKLITVCKLKWLPDEAYLKLMYYAHFGQKLNLDHPKTYNEKLQWLKLYDRNPRYTDMVDKQEVKRIITETIGEGYVIPTLGVWDDPEQIDFEALPDSFVLKTTHDSGTLVVCRDKNCLDRDVARKTMRKSLNNDYFYWAREWPYKNVKPRIIAEAYMEDSKTGELRDYKWYCFNGEPKIMAIFCGRGKGETTVDYFDSGDRHLDLFWGYPAASTEPEKPSSYEEMKRIAADLSRDIPCLRVDFYEVDGKPYVGELTFFDGAGFDRIQPREWDERIGSWIVLPGEKK